MTTTVLDLLPKENVSNFKFEFFIFRRINDTLSTKASVNPSLGPFITFSVTGISTLRLTNPLASQ